VFFVEIWLLY